MIPSRFLLLTYLSLSITAVSVAASPSVESTSPRVTLPIRFTKSLRSDRAKSGDPIYAKTTQTVTLANGEQLPAGASVIGHVVAASASNSEQEPSQITIQFDGVQVNNETRSFPLHVRAIADVFTSWEAAKPWSTDIDTLGTLTQVGGDQLVPSQSEVRDSEGNVVGHQRHGGVYAALAAHGDCRSTTEEVAVGIYSASACGVYGFDGASATGIGSSSSNPALKLTANGRSLEIPRDSTALLETGL